MNRKNHTEESNELLTNRAAMQEAKKTTRMFKLIIPVPVFVFLGVAIVPALGTEDFSVINATLACFFGVALIYLTLYWADSKFQTTMDVLKTKEADILRPDNN